MIFQWQYQGSQERRLRSVLKSFGVTSSLLKVAIFHGGALKIDGRPAWAVDQVSPGQKVAIDLPNEPANPRITPFPGPFMVAYEDDDFLIINKDAGVATVPAHNVTVQDSLVNRVKNYYQVNHYPNQVTHVATRLDKDTSGLVIFPKHRFAHAVLDRQLKHHQVKKYYTAIVEGRLSTTHGYIYAPIGRNPESFVQRQVCSDGKESVTEYWTEVVGEKMTKVRIRLHTGRTHQIRVHFSFLGHPLVGDDMYGGQDSVITRQALHCQEISFYSPFKKQQIVCQAMLPNDMQKLIKQL
ncbi:RluA family pseudouridine synthase [uncultured Limosilactobacillus sp.]|uniref:RluA family pseudouridine synthase n=1 Tax=uncultured Limosilactobacillus sp. TaxID=2837629 RepID=UPI0025D12198|nr:RluA family pseudouridine synthase [uncultured Limosilactobacillus sp.]